MKYNFNDDLKAALGHAMDIEYSKFPTSEELDYEYHFSSEFEKKMKSICQMATRVYVSFGSRRLRLLTAVILIIVMVFALATAAIAMQKLYIRWNESLNSKDGTIDITFDVDDPNQIASNFQYIKPKTPVGYHIDSEVKYSATEYEIQYSGDDGTVIYYSQSGNVAFTEVGVDSDADYQKISVNGYIGYSYKKAANSALIWSDGISLFQIIGTCDLAILEDMVKK